MIGSVSSVSGVSCGSCGETLPIQKTDPRFSKLRGEMVKLHDGTRALEFEIHGACADCGGSIVRIALDTLSMRPPST